MNTLVMGGAASGKSGWAEALAAKRGGQLLYIATMRPYGSGAQARIARHRTGRRGRGFATLERYTNLGGLRLEGRPTVLLECLGNLLANELFDGGDHPGDARDEVLQGLHSLGEQCGHLVVVSNEVSCDGERYSQETTHYRELLCAVNNAVAAEFPQVVEVVCGIPLWRKGEGA